MDTSFDYIVIGGGAAACALAGRLADSGSESIALLEAAWPDDDAPDWGPYLRGAPSDYDGWAEAGCDGWSWDDVLPCFRRAECNTRVMGRDDDPWHGGNGPLHVGDPPAPSPLARYFVESAAHAGHPRNDDFNGPDQEGVGWFQSARHRGEPWSAARAYLHRGVGGNLQVLHGMQAQRIVFEGRRAVGVQALRHGRQIALRARREVVLAAGAIGSPQLLMVSGIGPADHLQEHGIGVVQHLPGVGLNLQQPVGMLLHKRGPTPPSLRQSFGPRWFGVQSAIGMSVGRTFAAAWHWLRHGAGLGGRRSTLAQAEPISAGALLKSQPELPEPDLQLRFVVGPGHARGDGGGHGQSYGCRVLLLRPRSRGRLRLAGSDPQRRPLVEAGLLGDPQDVRDLIAGVALVRRILAQPPLAAFGGKALYCGGVRADPGDEAAIDALVRAHAEAAERPAGTCRMGIDALSVVDPQLRVRGVEALRVADASIMPTLAGGDADAPAIMIGERAHDLIRHGPRVRLRALETLLARA